MRVPEVVAQLREAGFELSDRLDAIGVLLGHADEACVPHLRDIDGVTAIEEQRAVESLDDDADQR